MGDILAYTIQVSVLMTVLFICYKALLSSATFHSFKRFVLLGILAGAWLLPICVPSKVNQHIASNTTTASTTTINEFTPTVEVGMPMQIPDNTAMGESTSPWWYYIAIIYAIGGAGVFVITLISAIKLAITISGGKHRKCNGYIEVITNKVSGPCSWGRYVMLRQQDIDESLPMVLTHELRHVSRMHWIDTLLCSINIVLLWYNPFAWLLLKELRKIHEFEADRAITPQQTRSYQLMLIKKTVGSSFPTFANSLNHSQIYIRITMMMKSKSNSARRLAALALPGVALVSLMALSQPSVANVLSSIRNASVAEDIDCKVSENQADAQITQVLDIVANDFNPAPDVVAQEDDAIPAEDAVTEIVTDTDNSAEDTTDDKVITMRVNGEDYKVEKSGATPAYFVNGALYTKSINDISPEQIKSITVVKDDPKYPDGKVMIELKGDDDAQLAVEQVADFKGGMQNLLQWIGTNMRYPEEAIKNNEEGRVIVQFTVGADGKLTSPRIMKGVSTALDNEALRLINEMPAWTPAYSDGKPVASKFVLPITFKLTPSATKK